MTAEDEYQGVIDLTEQFYFCSMPLRLDTYGGCGFRCKYCFARAQEFSNISKMPYQGMVRPGDVGILARALGDASRNHSHNLVTELLIHRVPIHWGGQSDPFQAREKRYQCSRVAMENLSFYRYPTVISTKGTMLTEEPYLTLLKEGNYIVQISLITDDDTFLKALEPGAPSASERLRVMSVLANAGIRVACRIQPLIPNCIVEWKLPDLISSLKDYGIYHVVIEGLKIRGELKEGLVGLVPNLLQAFGARYGRELLMTPQRKWKYLKVAKAAAKEAGITLGGADNELRNLGDTYSCCGTDGIPGFENVWNYQSGTVTAIAQSIGYCTLEDLEMVAWIPQNKYKFQDYYWVFEQGKRQSAQSLQTAMMYAWMHDDKGKGPSHLVCLRRGYLNGKVVYYYQDPIPILESQQAELFDAA